MKSEKKQHHETNDTTNNESVDQKDEKQDALEQQYLRVSADFQNYKRRVEKEKARWTTYAQMDVVNALLPFIDELQLSVKSAEKMDLDEDTKKWLDGFKMIYVNAKKALEKIGVTEIDCSGPFDPTYHEALLHVDSEDHESGEVVEVFTPGYLLNGEVVRHAKVSVAK